MTISRVSSHPARSVLIVEDHPLIRRGLAISLNKLTNYKVVGEATDGESAISEAQRLRPEVIVMDIGLPVTDGIEATWRIKQGLPHTKIVMLTSHDDPKDVMAALGSGADAYCVKESSIDHLQTAIESAVNGETWIDPALIDNMIGAGGNPSKPGSMQLSSIEKATLNLLKTGLDQTKVAERLETKPEKIGEVIYGIIDRLAEPTHLAHRQGSSDTESDIFGEWFAATMESSSSGRVFAGKYLIEHQIGAGNFGTVWKAKHLLMERTVALKLLTSGSGQRDVVSSFRNEAVAIANLHHPNIVSIYDFGITTEREPFLVMEFVNGCDLQQLINQRGKLEIQEFVQLFGQICDGLSCAHARKVIHCDLKPSNILVAMDEQGNRSPKLVDFGIARVIDRQANDNPEGLDYVRGTPVYMAPEQCAGGPLDERADIYALGCMMFECLTGRKAIYGANLEETMSNHFRTVPERISAFLPANSYPKELELCIARTLEKDPDHRVQTVNEIKQVLERIKSWLPERLTSA